MSNAENILLFDAVFAILLVSYGVGIGTADLTTLQSIPGPPLPPLPPSKCASNDFICQATGGISQATAYIGWAILALPGLIGYLAVETILFLNIILQITFSPQFGANGVPVIGFFWVGLQLYVLFEVFRMFRGSSSGV